VDITSVAGLASSSGPAICSVTSGSDSAEPAPRSTASGSNPGAFDLGSWSGPEGFGISAAVLFAVEVRKQLSEVAQHQTSASVQGFTSEPDGIHVDDRHRREVANR